MCRYSIIVQEDLINSQLLIYKHNCQWMQVPPEELPINKGESTDQKEILKNVQQLTNLQDQRDEMKPSSSTSGDQDTPAMEETKESLVASSQTSASKTNGKSDRAFKGDWGYVDLYNSSVDNFFSLEYLELPKSKKRKLEDSVVTTDRAYYRPVKIEGSTDEINGQVNSYEDLFDSLKSGTYWTADEKEIFFSCLARFTIHRIEDFLDHLPSKSTGEILAYYELLKRELRDQQICETHSVHIIEDQQDPTRLLRHEYDIVTIPGGIDQRNIPIAYEMSDEWVEYEEEQSIHIADRQGRLDVDRGKRESKAMKDYTKKLEDELGENFPLLDVNNAFKVSKIYRGNQITMVQDRKPTPRLLFPSLVYFEEIAALTIKKIIAFLLMNKDCNSLDEQGIKITSGDIWNAVRESGICEAPKSGKVEEKSWKSGVLENYWAGLQSSLRLVTDGPPAEAPDWEDFTPRELHGVIVPPAKKASFEYPDDVVEEGAYGAILDEDGIELEEDKSETEDPEGPDWWTVSKLKRPELNPPQVIDVLAEETRLIELLKDATDVAVDDALLLKETRLLESFDRRKHEALARAAETDFEGFVGTASSISRSSSSSADEESAVKLLASLKSAWNRHALY